MTLRFIILALLLQFFGCGLAVFVNLFIPFLGEELFAIIALALLAEILILWVIGKSVQVISFLRARGSASKTKPPETEENA